MPLDIVNRVNIGDNATLNFFEGASVATATVGGHTYLFAAEFGDNGVSAFAVSPDGTLTNVATVTDDATARLIAPIRPGDRQGIAIDQAVRLLLFVIDCMVQNGLANGSFDGRDPGI
jgi:hypothetical protein